MYFLLKLFTLKIQTYKFCHTYLTTTLSTKYVLNLNEDAFNLWYVNISDFMHIKVFSNVSKKQKQIKEC